MIDLDHLATQKASDLGEEAEIWKNRLHSYSQNGVLAALTDGEIERVLKSLNSVAQLDRLQKSFGQDPSALDRLFKACDASPFGFSDWLTAYDEFLLWLEAGGHSAAPEIMLGYLNCCVDSAKGKPQLETLKDLLRDMLEQFGFQGKIPSPPYGI